MVNTMNLKKIKIINVIFLFVLSFLWHFGYNLFPNNFTALFFPVNESIWEHMKIIYGCILVGSVLQYFLCKKYKIKINNISKILQAENIDNLKGVKLTIYKVFFFP